MHQIYSVALFLTLSKYCRVGFVKLTGKWSEKPTSEKVAGKYLVIKFSLVY